MPAHPSFDPAQGAKSKQQDRRKNVPREPDRARLSQHERRRRHAEAANNDDLGPVQMPDQQIEHRVNGPKDRSQRPEPRDQPRPPVRLRVLLEPRRNAILHERLANRLGPAAQRVASAPQTPPPLPSSAPRPRPLNSRRSVPPSAQSVFLEGNVSSRKDLTIAENVPQANFASLYNHRPLNDLSVPETP